MRLQEMGAYAACVSTPPILVSRKRQGNRKLFRLRLGGGQAINAKLTGNSVLLPLSPSPYNRTNDHH
jgi:hypothetical protein